jgi:hypothetical protein
LLSAIAKPDEEPEDASQKSVDVPETASVMRFQKWKLLKRKGER